VGLKRRERSLNTEDAPPQYLPEAWNHCVTALYEKRSNPTIWGHTIQVRNFAREVDGTEHSTGDNLCAAAVDADPAKLQVCAASAPALRIVEACQRDPASLSTSRPRRWARASSRASPV
jgi:hypothetical protein